MRRLSYLLAVLVLTAGWALAQTDTNSSSSTNSTNSTTTQQQPANQTDQNANTQATPSNPDQNANTQATPSTSDQTNSAATTSDQNAPASNGKKLPQTASPLPLLGLLGLGSVASGLVMRKKK